MKRIVNSEKELFALFKAGDIAMVPYLVTEINGRIEAEYEKDWSKTANVVHWHANYRGQFSDDLYLTYESDEITCRRLVKNISSQTIALKEAGIELRGIDFGKNPENNYYYHAENPRIYATMTLPVDFERMAPGGKDPKYDIGTYLSYVEAPCCSKRVGASPFQAFPAILLGNNDTEHALVHGTLEQKVFYHCYELCNFRGKVRVDIISGFKGISALDVIPNRTLTDRWYLGTTEHANDIERIFERYTRVLRSIMPPLNGAGNANRHSVVWESWNDCIERNVSEELMLKEAEFVHQNFPNVRYVQLDDGYWHNDKQSNGIGTAYEKDGGIDKNKFPSGLRTYSDKIRQFGLIPAIWIGLSCPACSQIANEHPEWKVDYAWRYKEYDGLECSMVLDPSIPEVREYLLYAFNKFCNDYNFSGIKLDFWSFVFETSAPLLKNREHSSYEWRRWLLTEIRKLLPTDAYFQTGCDIVQGNPFLGEFFTNYRYGLDISGGEWEHVKMTFLWGASCFALHVGDMFVPNSDSIGIMPGLSEIERMFAINYILISHSFVELSGKLHSDCSPEFLKVIKKALCNINNGQDVHFAQYDYRKHKAMPPAIWFTDTPLFSRKSGVKGVPLKTVGLFNLTDEEAKLVFSPADFKLENGSYILTDVWTGKQTKMKNSAEFALPRHGSLLLSLCEDEGIQIFDSNIRLERIDVDKLIFETDYEAEAELLLNAEPTRLLFNEEKIDFTFEEGVMKFHVPEHGILSFEF